VRNNQNPLLFPLTRGRRPHPIPLQGLLILPGSDGLIAVSGVSATGAIGTVVVSGGALKAATGVSATSAIGTSTAKAGAFKATSGVSATSAIGTATEQAGALKTVSGVSSASSVGSTTETAAGLYAVSGVSASSAVGTVTASGGGASQAATIAVVGVVAYSYSGNLTALGEGVPWWVFANQQRIGIAPFPEQHESIAAQADLKWGANAHCRVGRVTAVGQTNALPIGGCVARSAVGSVKAKGVRNPTEDELATILLLAA
jgi:hypothetical protein